MNNKKKSITKLVDDDYEFANRLNLKICRECYMLHGQIYLKDGQKVEQHCGCNRIEEEIWTYKIGRYKVRLDYNQLYEICYCCGLRIIKSGTRWSQFNCYHCHSKISQLNATVGRCVIPLGRHSMMNGVFLDRKAFTEPNSQAVISFIQAYKRTVILGDSASEYRKIILKKQIDRVDLPEDGSVFDFIQLTDNLGNIRPLQNEAFSGLLAHMTDK